MSYFTVGYRLPYFVSVPLFGDRERFGLIIRPEDPDWQEWLDTSVVCYDATQKQSFIGRVVNNAGYRVMQRCTLERMKVLEIGPGNLNHIANWRGHPEEFVLVDVRQSMLDRATERLSNADIDHSTVLLTHDSQGSLPFEDEEFDMLVTFYSLEHLYPLEVYLDEMLRVLRPGGQLVGAIPCEGGLAWGVGRYCTSRRWFLRNTSINPDKIICWEHPTFAEQILNTLDWKMHRETLSFWPFGIPSIDLNLIVRFIYEK